MNDIFPQYPIYIPTKGRYMYMRTSGVLTRMGIHHSLIVEPFEVDKYIKAIKEMNLNAEVIPLDMSYKEKYELCDEHGLTRSTGSGPSRNFAWEHSIDRGFDHHWIMDDNIRNFKRLNNNVRILCWSPSFFRAMEDFVLRYKNVGMAGPHYEFFVTDRTRQPPFITNTRLYSCNFIRNDIPYRWRGRYNEDTILSLDMLKGGWCTILFHAFLQRKMETQSLKGGNTDELYLGNTKRSNGKYSDIGTLEKSQMLARVHPDVAKVVRRFSRIHHEVNYKPFKKMKLIRKDGLKIEKGVNNYGMVLKVKDNASRQTTKTTGS